MTGSTWSPFPEGRVCWARRAAVCCLGRKDLIEAAQHAISPHGGIGRGMKVGKEELMGLLAAVERYLTGGSCRRAPQTGEPGQPTSSRSSRRFRA